MSAVCGRLCTLILLLLWSAAVFAGTVDRADLSVYPTSGNAPLGVTATCSCSLSSVATGENLHVKITADGQPFYELTEPASNGTRTIVGAHTFYAPGDHQVACTCEVVSGGTVVSEASAAPVAVRVEGTLSAQVSVTPSTVSTGTPVAASCAVSGGTPPYTYRIDFGDGNAADGSGISLLVSHAYDAPGLYAVRCTVTDANGVSASDETTVFVEEVVRPEVSLIILPDTNLSAGENATVICQVFGSRDPADITVDFGDGESANASGYYAQVRHAWESPGLYTVRCSAQVGSERYEATAGVAVAAAETAPPSITALTVSPANGTEVHAWCAFRDPDASSGSAETVSIDWGDGSHDNTTAAVTDDGEGSVELRHTYAGAGNYTVTCTVTDADGNTDRVSTTVSVSFGEESAAPPEIVYFGAHHPGTDSLTLEFVCAVADPDSNELHITLDFGDGDSEEGTVDLSTGAHTFVVRHTYEDSKERTARCVVSDGTHTASREIRVFGAARTCAGAETPGGASLELCYGRVTRRVEGENGTRSADYLQLFLGSSACGGDCGRLANLRLTADLNGDGSPDVYFDGLAWREDPATFQVFLNPFEDVEILESRGVGLLFDQAEGRTVFRLEVHLDGDAVPEATVILPVEPEVQVGWTSPPNAVGAEAPVRRLAVFGLTSKTPVRWPKATSGRIKLPGSPPLLAR